MNTYQWIKIVMRSFAVTVFCALIAFPAYSSEVTYADDSYTSGDTLTAADLNAKFNELKTDVNDNNAQIVAGVFFGGDGSFGDKTLAGSESWAITPSSMPDNLNFANFTIPVGMTLTVPAGTTIRCSGDFINNGIINVSTGATLGASGSIGSAAGPTQGISGIAHPGDSFGSASSGRYHSDIALNAKSVSGGDGGIRIPEGTFKSSFNSLRIGGGSGGGWSSGSGGGLLKVYCRGSITNLGTINADGGAGSTQTGGGGGGIVILGSMTTVDNSSGTINANGGNGGSFSYGGSGGGGGGGIVGLIAPVVVQGTVNVARGTVQTATGSVTGSVYGGGGGGASGGNGGRGGSVGSTGVKGSGALGADGYTSVMIANPASLLF